MMRLLARSTVAAGLLFAIWMAGPGVSIAEAAPEGQMVWAFHVTLAPRWLDPADTESVATPFKILYALHDALVKPMPAGLNTPCLAESWSVVRRKSPTARSAKSCCSRSSGSSTSA